MSSPNQQAGSSALRDGEKVPSPAIRADSHETVDAVQAARLARSFVREPELIRACLEPGNGAPVPNLETILAAAKQAILERPHYADLHYFAAEAALRHGDLGDARRLADGALTLNPQYRDALVLAGRVALAQEELDDAVRYVRRALHCGADYADVHVLLGDLSRARGQAAGAQAAYQRALSLNGSLRAARLALESVRAGRQDGGSDELPA